VRLASVDAFRGFAVVSMILVNFLAFFDATPPFLKHAKGSFITFADLVAPLFLFALGMMYRKSIMSKISTVGRRKAYLLFTKRYLLILVVGIIGGCFGKMSLSLDWGILQAIGSAGLIALPFIALRVSLRILVGAILLLVHQLGILPLVHESVARAEQGGPLATLAWTAMIIFSSTAGDLLSRGSNERIFRAITILSCGIIALGLASAHFTPLSKVLVTASYIIMTTGISAALFGLFVAAEAGAALSIAWLIPLGHNALLVFLMHYALVKAGHRLMSRSASLPLVLAGSAAIFLLCYAAAYILDRKRIYLKV